MIKSSRIRLVKVCKTNAGRFHEIDFSSDIMKYITGRPITGEEAIKRYSFNIDHPYFGAYFVEGEVGNEIIGLAVIKEKGKFAEIGYMVHPCFKGNGIATEINRMLIDICREKLTSYQICAFVDERNKASIRVLEKSGMNQKGTRKDGEVISLRFTI